MEMEVGELKPFCSSYFCYYPDDTPPALLVPDLSPPPLLTEGLLDGEAFY